MGIFNFSRPRSKPWLDFTYRVQTIFLTAAVLVGVPAFIYYRLLLRGWDLLWFQGGITTLYLVAALILMIEATSIAIWQRSPRSQQRRGVLQSWFGRSVPHPQVRRRAQQVPKCSLVVVAYLPNEQHIILDTLHHILAEVQRPQGGLEVVLAYNTPVTLPVEQDLQALAIRYPELRLLHVTDSHSKAENLNAALGVVTGEMTAIFDSDHLPAPDCLFRAWAWLQSDRYDVVQGRNAIRNHRQNWLTRLIAVEFDCLYGVSHPARSLLVNTALFGGSNGYWRTLALQQVCFRQGMLTEDVDASLRALMGGYRVVHDPQIVSWELAPVDLGALWSQRQRWTQGWLEVALQYQTHLWSWQSLDGWQKTCWAIMLLYSSVFHVLAVQVFALMINSALFPTVLPTWLVTYNFVVGLLSLLCNHYQAAIAHAYISPRRYWRWDILAYTLTSPFFFLFKTLIALVSLYNCFVGKREWIVTRRHGAQALSEMVRVAPQEKIGGKP